jgi:hypothetical protein
VEEGQGRRAANEAWFREINDQIENHALRHGPDRRPYDFICECADIDCVTRIQLTLAEYERVRAHPARFAVAPGHVQPDIEDVVQRDGFWIVQKKGRAADAVLGRSH